MGFDIAGKVYFCVFFQVFDKLLVFAAIVLVGAAHRPVNIAGIEAHLNKRKKRTKGYVFIVDGFNRRPDQGAVEQKSDQRILIAFTVKLAAARKDRKGAGQGGTLSRDAGRPGQFGREAFESELFTVGRAYFFKV